MVEEFATEDIKNVFSKIMQFMDDSVDNTPKEQKFPKEKEEKILKKPIPKPQQIIDKKDSPSPDKPTKKISANQFKSTTYARFQARQQAVDEKIKRSAKVLDEKVLENVKRKPDINKNSKLIPHTPISERYEGVLKEKKKKISEMGEKLKSEQEKKIEKDLTFKPNIGKNSEKSVGDFSEILDRMREWEDKKNLKALMVKERVEGELKESLTFKPSLCGNSVKLAGEQGDQKDVVERLMDYKKTQIVPESYTFAPSLSSKTLKLMRNRSEGEVFSRLYSYASVKDLLAAFENNGKGQKEEEEEEEVE